MQTLGASTKKEPRIAKWEEVNAPKNSLLSFEAVMDDYRIDERQWMKHIKPSLRGRLLTEWEAMPRQGKRNYDSETNGGLFNLKTRNR